MDEILTLRTFNHWRNQLKFLHEKQTQAINRKIKLINNETTLFLFHIDESISRHKMSENEDMIIILSNLMYFLSIYLS